MNSLYGRVRRHRIAAATAAFADAVEGLALLRVLDGRALAANARRAQIAASIKFAVIAAALGYAVYPVRPTRRTCR